MNEADGHPELHRELSGWYYALADYHREMATYHAIKAADPLCEVPIPEKSEKCTFIKKGIDL